MLAVIVDRVLWGVFYVGAEMCSFFASAPDHVCGNSYESAVEICGELCGVDALKAVEEPASGRIAFAGFQGAVSAGVNDRLELVFFEKGGEACGIFGVNRDDVFSKNARVLDGANADERCFCIRVSVGRVNCSAVSAIEVGSAKEFIEVPEQRITRDAVQTQNQNREAQGSRLERVAYFCASFHL